MNGLNHVRLNTSSACLACSTVICTFGSDKKAVAVCHARFHLICSVAALTGAVSGRNEDPNDSPKSLDPILGVGISSSLAGGKTAAKTRSYADILETMLVANGNMNKSGNLNAITLTVYCMYIEVLGKHKGFGPGTHM